MSIDTHYLPYIDQQGSLVSIRSFAPSNEYGGHLMSKRLPEGWSYIDNRSNDNYEIKCAVRPEEVQPRLGVLKEKREEWLKLVKLAEDAVANASTTDT